MPHTLPASLLLSRCALALACAFALGASNLDLPEWDQAFPANRLLASATLDRLRHNAYCLVLDGKSYRSPRLGPTTTLGKEEKNDVKNI